MKKRTRPGRVSVAVAVAVARISGWLVAVALLLALALLVVLRTAPGRRALLRVALSVANDRMAGHLGVRGIDGDLWHRVVLLDVRLDDAEGSEAIYARRVEVRLDLGALWQRRVHVRDLAVDGARLTMRHLADNRFNLAALGKAGADVRESPPPKPSQQPPLLVEIDHFHVQLDGAYHPPRGHENNRVAWPRGTFDIEGSAELRGGAMHFVVARLVSDARDPLQAHVELRGGLAVTPHGTPVGKAELTFEDVDVTVVSDGAELARLDPRLHARGRWQLHAQGGGALADLHAHAILAAPRGSVTVDGSMSRLFPGLRWQALVVGADLDGAADWDALPAGRIDFEVAAGGVRDEGQVTLARLDARGAGIAISGHGRSDFGGHGDGVVRAAIESLARLRDFGVRVDDFEELDGRVQLAATLGRDAEGPRLDATVRGDGLRVRHGLSRTTAQHFDAHAIVRPGEPMQLRVAGRDLELDGVGIARRAQPLTLRIRELALELRGSPRRFSVDSSVALADGTRAHAVARTAVGAGSTEVTLTTLTLDRGELHFALPETTHVQLSGKSSAPRIVAVGAGARVEANLRISRERLAADVSLALPDLARVGQLASVAVSGAARAHAAVTLAEELTIDATVDGERLRGPHVAAARLHASLHSVDLVGDARLDGEALALGQLTLSHLLLHAHGTRERLTLTLDGERPDARGPSRVVVAADGRWRTAGLRVVDAELWLRAANLSLPRQAWRLVTPAHVTFHRGVGSLAGLRLRSAVGELWVDGRWGEHVLDLTVLLDGGDLEELARVAGHPGLLPAARWTGRVHLGGSATAPLVEARLDARADQTVAWLGLGLNTLSLTASADSHHAVVHADSHGHGDSHLVIDAHGAPKKEGERFVAIAGTLDRVQITVHGHTWFLRETCAVDLGARLRVDNCRLDAPGRGEIALTGNAPLSPSGGDALDVTLSTRHLDLRDLHAMLAPGHQEPPKTDFEIHAHVSGTRQAPVADLQLSGRGSEIDEGGLPENVNYRISAHYADQRVRGQVSARQVGMRLGIGARFDLPTTLGDGEQPISLELEARPVPFFKIRQLLPTAIANLKGFFSLRLNATGTVRHPRVNGELHIPSWGLDDLRDNNTIVNLAYDGHELALNSVTSFDELGLVGSLLRLQPPRNSGTVTMELRAPVDLVRLLRAPKDAVHAMVHDAPLVASAEVRNVDLRKVPMQIIGFDTPLTFGLINARIRGGGTLHRPTLNAEVHAVGLGQPGVVDHLDVEGSVAWENARAKLSGRASLRGAPLLTFGGSAGLDGRRLADGDGWGAGALAIDVAVPAYALSHLRNLQPRLHAVDGSVQGEAHLRGTFAAPDLRVTAEGHDVGLARARFSRIAASVRLHDRRWTFAVVGSEAGGGTARVAGELPRDEDAPLHLAVDAQALDVGFLGVLWSEIGEVSGTLGAHILVSGTPAEPRPVGWAQLSGGRFAFRGDKRSYQAAFELHVDDEEAQLTRLELHGGGGTLDATGRARLDGLRPTELSLDAHAHAFVVAYGSAEARFDADFQIAGSRADGVFRGQLALARGTLTLPELGGLGATDRLGGMADVRFADSRSRGNERRREAGQGAFIALRVDGPFAVRGREANLDLTGELGVTAAGSNIGVEGIVEALGGQIELLGKRYVVERAQLAFGGAFNDPELHLRVTRRIGRATVAVVIEGTAKNPEVRLSCDPPVYDQAQLISLILAGKSPGERLAIRDLNREISGILSAVVIRKIQEQLAPALPVDLARSLDQQSYAEFSATPIEVGRFVSDRIYVRYEQHYGGSQLGRSAANSDEASADLRLSKGFRLSTSFGDAGVGGVYILWTTKR